MHAASPSLCRPVNRPALPFSSDVAQIGVNCERGGKELNHYSPFLLQALAAVAVGSVSVLYNTSSSAEAFLARRKDTRSSHEKETGRADFSLTLFQNSHRFDFL